MAATSARCIHPQSSIDFCIWTVFVIFKFKKKLKTSQYVHGKNRKVAGEKVVNKPPIGLVNPSAHDGGLASPSNRDGSNEYTGIEVDESMQAEPSSARAKPQTVRSDP